VLLFACSILLSVLTISSIASGWLHGARPTKNVGILWPADGEDGDAVSGNFGRVIDSRSFGRIGLFGDLLPLLERNGHNVSRISDLSSLRLGEQDAILIPELFRPLNPFERTGLNRWIEDGGTLVVAAEHSNLAGIRDYLRPLLEPLGIDVNFDTTSGLTGDGITATWAPSSPLRQSLREAPYLPYARGASLSLSKGALPVLVGTLWHADLGDALSPDRANLSDYRLSRNDRVGDVVLIGTSKRGKGRIIVMGDSSPILSMSLLYSSRFVLSVLDSNRTSELARAQTIRDAALLLAAILALTLLQSQSWMLRAFLALFLLGAAAMRIWEPAAHGTWPEDARLAVVSTGENNILDTHDPFSRRSPTALGLCFLRENFTPWLGDWTQLRTRPAIVAMVNPTREIESASWRKLLRWVQSGTDVILAGNGDSDAFAALAARLGVEVSRSPLGSIEDATFTTFSAWSVTAIPRNSEPLRVADRTFGTTIPVGLGQIVVLADGGFLLSENLELEHFYDERNISFVRSLIRKPGRSNPREDEH